MASRLRLLLPVMLTVLLALVPAHGNGATIGVEPQALGIAVGSGFSVDVWIRGLPWGMQNFGFTMTWNPNLMSYASHQISLPNPQWSMTVDTSQVNSGQLQVSAGLQASGSGQTGDRKWLTVSFRCKAAGSSQINLPDSHWMDDGGFQQGFTPRPGMVSQTGSSVGGVIAPAYAITILSAYLTVIGLAATTATVVVKKRRN